MGNAGVVQTPFSFLTPWYRYAIAKTLAALPALVGKVVFWIVLLVAALVGVPFLLGFWAGGWRERARRRKADRTKQE